MAYAAPLLMAVLFGLGMWMFSTWRLGRELDAKSTPLTDPVITGYTGQMARALDLPKLDVYVYEVPMINGLAAPDGRIFITRGFLDKYRLGQVRADEIAGVIAHELGHVALGHAQRRMLDFTGQNVIRMVLGMVLSRFIPFVGMWLANLLAHAFAARLSRQDEYEADAYAAALMSKIGLGVEPQIRLFDKLEKIAGGAPGGLAWLMSHPNTKDRVRALRALEDGWRR